MKLLQYLLTCITFLSTSLYIQANELIAAIPMAFHQFSEIRKTRIDITSVPMLIETFKKHENKLIVLSVNRQQSSYEISMHCRFLLTTPYQPLAVPSRNNHPLVVFASLNPEDWIQEKNNLTDEDKVIFEQLIIPQNFKNIQSPTILLIKKDPKNPTSYVVIEKFSLITEKGQEIPPRNLAKILKSKVKKHKENGTL